VTSIQSYGVFAELEPGLEGLIHVSVLGLTSDQSPEDVTAAGQQIEVTILAIDEVDRRISLGLNASSSASESEMADDPTPPATGDPASDVEPGAEAVNGETSMPEVDQNIDATPAMDAETEGVDHQVEAVPGQVAQPHGKTDPPSGDAVTEAVDTEVSAATVDEHSVSSQIPDTSDTPVEPTERDVAASEPEGAVHQVIPADVETHPAADEPVIEAAATSSVEETAPAVATEVAGADPSAETPIREDEATPKSADGE
ncbi:MAG: S1 RNA-binding domain-containing protein, partial [Actinomycetota bacterium]|nr:S1 RNA-binding domain-containing protein [Actinomycetota bacterium]